MNIQEMDLVNIIEEDGFTTQRELAQKSGYSLGKVNASLRLLVENGYLGKDYELTEAAEQLFRERSPKGAIILAAGSGMRMVPINTEVPKGLLEVRGEPLIERVIVQLHDAGIHKIRIIVGFMKEQYEYLIDKYGVELIYNRQYASKNNLCSLALAGKWLENTYIIPCDIWCASNPFRRKEVYSWYMVSSQPDRESNVRINRKKELVVIGEEEIGSRMVGIAYLCGKEAEYIRNQLENMKNNRRFAQAFWEETAVKEGKMVLLPRLVPKEQVREINTLEELRELDENSDQLNSELLDIIAETLDCGQQEIREIEALKKGMTNRSFRFRCREKRYIMRVPGEGTEQMINRRQEYAVYQVVEKKGYCDPVCYMDPENGYKITEFLEDARVCDPMETQDVRRCMRFLRSMHESGMKVDHEFDIFGQIEQYESYWGGTPSIFRDYKETKCKMYELKEYIDRCEKEWTLTHIDAVPDNFLFVGDRIYLIDWEYSGMQDPHVDLAMFIIYAMYDQDKAEELIDAYFEGQCPENTRTKIYCYIAVCGFLWSNWCEFKRICGVEFGEYSLRQYRYAKEYYKIAKERMNDE